MALRSHHTPMTNPEGRVEPPRAGRDVESLRWKVGIGISLFFGIFGAVMAFLTYTDRRSPRSGPAVAQPAATAPAAAPATPPSPGRARGRGHQ